MVASIAFVNRAAIDEAPSLPACKRWAQPDLVVQTMLRRLSGFLKPMCPRRRQRAWLAIFFRCASVFWM